MKWYVLVFFLSVNPDGSQNTFIFKNPTYDNREECMASLTKVSEIQKYVLALMTAYGGVLPSPIEKVNCINQESFDQLLEIKRQQLGERDT